ncbi:MAG: IMPACT family protein [Bacteroidales bacterium]
MPVTDVYHTIASPAEGLYKEKGSKFMAFAYPVEEELQIHTLLDTLKDRYHDARHHCYAYALGPNRERFRYYDDGEPSGTAGKPIYGQILSFDVTNILIVVVRYFGGTLLGTGGLIQAYKSAAADALQKAQIIEQTVGHKFLIRFDYPLLDRVKYILKNFNTEIIKQTFDTHCELVCRVRLQSYSLLIQQLRQWDNMDIIELDFD